MIRMTPTFVFLAAAVILQLTSAGVYVDNVCHECNADDKSQCIAEQMVHLRVQVEEELSPEWVWTKPTLVGVTGQGREILAVTTHGNDMFVSRTESGYVEVYNISRGVDEFIVANLKPYRHLAVPRLKYSYGLATNAEGDYLFVADYGNNLVHKVPLTGNDKVISWRSATNRPMGLTINNASNVVVTYMFYKIQEFSQTGSLVREVSLGRAMGIKFSVQLSNGNYVVSYKKNPRSTKFSVSEFGSNGKARRTFTTAGYPAGLAVDRNDIVLVADSKYNRILALNPTLRAAQVMSLSVIGGLRGPYSLHLDKEDTRLCVGEFLGKRALVFDKVKIPTCRLQ